MKALFVVATERNEANYYLIWDLLRRQVEQGETIFDCLVIITTEFTERQDCYKNLLRALKSPIMGLDFSLKTDKILLKDGIEEKSVTGIKAVIQDWIDKEKPDSILFNITGGTKLISIAQDQIASTSPNYHCIYQNRQNKALYYDGNTEQVFAIAVPDDVGMKLICQGYRLKHAKKIDDFCEARRSFARTMFAFLRQDIAKAQALITFINSLCAKMKKAVQGKGQEIFPYTLNIKDHYTPDIKDPMQALSDFAPWLKELQGDRQGLFVVDYNLATFCVSSWADLLFLQGGWFELAFAMEIDRYYGTQVAVLTGLEFVKDSDSPSDGNEIDIAYMYNGRLYVFECKTVNYKNRETPTKDANNMLHKLNSVGQITSTDGGKYFVSLYEISEQSKKVAKEKKIRLIAGKDLLSLACFLPPLTQS